MKACCIFVILVICTVISPKLMAINTIDINNFDESKDTTKTGSEVLALSKVKPGNHLKFMVYDKKIASYLLNIPPSYDENEPTPLVVALHGRGERDFLMADKTGLNDKADEEGFIVVYPNGIGGFLMFKWWNSGIFWPIIISERDIDDVGFIKRIIERLESNLNINSSRIYVTGHSNGAMMAYRVGAELSEKISAIAPVAGTIGGRETDDSFLYTIPEPSFPVSAIIFHGMQDEQIPYDGGKFGGIGLRKPYFLSVNDSVSFWVEHNNCSIVPQINMSDSENIIRKTYSNGNNSSEVVLYSVVNGGHEWFGSPWDPPFEISATDLIWNFFVSHPNK